MKPLRHQRGSSLLPRSKWINGSNGPGQKRGKSNKSGQALTEYVIVFILLIGVFIMVSAFLTVFKEYGGRVLDLVASEFP